MTTTEEYLSYLIKKINELEKRVVDLEEIAHTKTLEQACQEHLFFRSTMLSEATMKEKDRYGALMSGGRKENG